MGSDPKGFTLMEVLISLVIVSVAVAGMMSVFLVGMRQTSQSSNKVASAQEAAKLLEKLKISLAADFSSLPLGLSNPPWHAGCDNDSVTYDVATGSVTALSLDALAADTTPPDRCDHIFYDDSGVAGPTTHYAHLSNSFFSADFFKKYQGRLRYLVEDSGAARADRYKVSIIVDWQEPTQ